MRCAASKSAGRRKGEAVLAAAIKVLIVRTKFRRRCSRTYSQNSEYLWGWFINHPHTHTRTHTLKYTYVCVCVWRTKGVAKESNMRKTSDVFGILCSGGRGSYGFFLLEHKNDTPAMGFSKTFVDSHTYGSLCHSGSTNCWHSGIGISNKKLKKLKKS